MYTYMYMYLNFGVIFCYFAWTKLKNKNVHHMPSFPLAYTYMYYTSLLCRLSLCTCATFKSRVRRSKFGSNCTCAQERLRLRLHDCTHTTNGPTHPQWLSQRAVQVISSQKEGESFIEVAYVITH